MITGDQRRTAVVMMVLQSMQAASRFLHVQRFKRNDGLADQTATEPHDPTAAVA